MQILWNTNQFYFIFQSKRDQLEEKISLRQKQLHVLVTSLHQLKQTLADDSVTSASDDLCVIDEVIDLTGPVPTVTLSDSGMDTA